MIRERRRKENPQEIKKIDMHPNSTFDILRIGNRIPLKIPIINNRVQNLKVVFNLKYFTKNTSFLHNINFTQIHLEESIGVVQQTRTDLNGITIGMTMLLKMRSSFLRTLSSLSDFLNFNFLPLSMMFSILFSECLPRNLQEVIIHSNLSSTSNQDLEIPLKSAL